MRRFSVLLAAAALVAGANLAFAKPPVDLHKPKPVQSAESRLVEPTLRLSPSGSPAGRVALTLDACGGQTDHRILDALVENRIPATVFVTGIWLKRNAEAFAILRAHPELFEIENHGERHVPAVGAPATIYGIKAAGSREAVTREVEKGAEQLQAAGGSAPHWFRGATAKYDSSAIAVIGKLGYRIAGYSLNADGGSLLGAALTEKHVANAKDGDVIIAHINQPTHSAGAGLVKGLLELKARGVTFVRLQDAAEVAGS
ncbi:polysaccharide deacetylase family protein [Mesorhizobium sp. BAC0120]|uniref:polysaccharide deacetylase family protein n=1 Tax=Mesorhizobium sp. BAC0120 TaxID=3090670 RepID=UPI00298CB5D7|nr:polysaccharide deacetylase family protein [Mesorhizobium sp. BAC0120]MDW6020943.1 polysaccharide deacetylase family protein [Mesorhizobium sp. BAC0120]